VVVREAVWDGQQADTRLRRRRLGSKAAEVVVGMEEGDVEAGVEEGGGEVEHAVDVALQRPWKHQHVRRRVHPLIDRPVRETAT
jgi:hypothetical protein